MSETAIEMKGSGSVLRIEGEMTIYRAAELKALLSNAIEAKSALKLDLSQVGEIDSAGVQLLLASKAAAQAGWEIVAHSATVSSTLELLRLNDLLSASSAAA